jgi:two-component system NtrC family sensor kinase
MNRMKKIMVLVFVGICTYNFSMGQLSLKQLDGFKNQLRSASNDSVRGVLYFQLANGYRFSNVDSSLYYADLAYEYARKTGKLIPKAYILSLKGATLLESGRLPESMQLQFEALKFGEESKDNRVKGFIINRIGNTYMELADYKNANEYYFRSKELFESVDDSGMVYNEISNIGNIYELMGIPDSAMYYQRSVYEASEKNPDRQLYVRPEIMFRMGNVYRLIRENEEALTFYKRGVLEANIDNDIRNLTMNNLFLAQTYKEMGMGDSSLKYALNTLKTGQAVSFRKGIYEASMLISDLYRNRQQYDSAYKYLLRANAEKDSLTGPKRIQELQRIVLGEQERLRETEKNRIAVQNRQRQYALLGGLGVFLVIASILYRNNRQKQKTNKVLETTLNNLKSAQAQLIQSEKMASLGELTAGIAHEIQNPLNFVNNFSDVNTELIGEMQEEITAGNYNEAVILSNNVKSNQEKISFHGRRADTIVKGMLQHSRRSSGVKEPVDINALANEYLRLAYHGLRAKDKSFNATMKTDYDSSVGTINIIPQDIGRVILNLITNAFYSVTEKKKEADANFEPTVTVKTKRKNEDVLIQVKDNGIGIPQHLLDKIFQPFFTTKPTGQGTGLGLSLSYDIVKAHGGELKVETRPGEGAAFTIYLPSS